MNLVMPNYERCNLNIITSILKYYGVESKHASLKELDEKLNSKKYKNVILLIMDGMGEHILNNISPNGYLNNNKNTILTCVYPSTTTASLTTYYSGKPPFESGWIAWSQYFKEYGRALDMLSHKESYYRESLRKPNLDVFAKVVNYETIFERIEKASPNVKAYELVPSYSDKRSKRTYRADTLDEIIDAIHDLTNSTGERFIFGYCDNPDATLHKFGAYSDEAKEFILSAEEKIQKMCEELSEDTLVIISADHGHKDIEKAYTLLDYPEILECLIMPASLESRVVGFWVKEEMREEFVERFNNVFGEEFWLMTREEFLEKNFLGFGEKHKKIDEFIGNYIALSTGGSIIRLETFLVEGKPVKKSTHCGLSKEEMEVPVLIISKD